MSTAQTGDIDMPEPDLEFVAAEKTASPIPNGYAKLERLLAVVAVAALGVRIPISQGVTPGYALALALLPLWAGCLRRYRGARWVVGCAVGCIPSAVVLVHVHDIDHRFELRVFIGTTVLLIGLITGLGVLLWSRTLISSRVVGVAFGLGMLAGSLAYQGELTETNPLKFAVALPAAIIVLSLVNRPSRLGWQLVALLALALFGALVDARSFFAICLLSAALVAWQMRPRIISRRGSWGWTVLLIAVVGAVVYYLGTTLAVDGYLGVETQQRSIAQIQTSGSLITGGRPELGATVALMQREPWGFGAGTVPNLLDVNSAKTGMAALGYDPNNGYVEGYLLGTSVNLHSMVGDTWASFGIVGVLLTGSSFYLIVRGAATRIAERRAGGLIVLLASYTLWNTFFSPFYSSVPVLTLGLAFLLLPADTRARPVIASTP